MPTHILTTSVFTYILSTSAYTYTKHNVYVKEA